MSTEEIGFETFGMDDDSAASIGDATRYKGKAGETDRVSFAYFPLDDDGAPDLAKAPLWVKANRHYVQGVGYFVSGGKEWDDLAAAHGSKGPKTNLATVVVIWPTSSDGSVDKERLKKDWKVRTLVVSKDKFSALVKIHQEWGLGSSDVSITCTDAQYQKMTYTPCKQHFLKDILANPKAVKLKARLMAAITDAIEVNMKNDLGKPLTLDQLRERLGVGGGSPVAPASAENIDDMMMDLLDEDEE